VGKINLFSIPIIFGITLCISPIALMKDQVDGLKANGIPPVLSTAVKPRRTNKHMKI
jgi:superfamily II DNA helicase RecQ